MNRGSYSITALICIVLITLLLGGCGKSTIDNFFIEGQGDKFTFEKFINSVNINRKSIIENPKSLDISIYTFDFNDERDMFTNEDIEILTAYKDSTNLTKDEAIIDVEIAFNLLKYSYGAYEYFGGDKVFANAEKNIIKSIKSVNVYEILYGNFERIFANELKFINDGHFTVGYSKLCNYKHMYTCTEYVPIYEKNNFYINYKDGTKAKIISINDDNNLNNYIKPTINDEGQISYGLISLFDNNDEAEIINTMIVKYENKEETVVLKWNMTKVREASKDEPVYEKKVIDGIPVYCVYEMYGDENLLKKFSDSAFGAREEKVFIVDLRGNGGGTDLYANNWFLNYTGNYPDKPISSAYKITNVGIGMDIKECEYLTAEEIKLAEKGKWNIGENKGVWVENDNLIIVLIDKNVASAGEDMIANLSYLVSGNSGKCLPNSGMYLNYGYGIILNNDGKNIDGIGFLPDLWVPASQALELAFKMIEFYQLN